MVMVMLATLAMPIVAMVLVLSVTMTMTMVCSRCSSAEGASHLSRLCPAVPRTTPGACDALNRSPSC
eukprot:5839080-Pyramimonas_sp.AAC.1